MRRKLILQGASFSYAAANAALYFMNVALFLENIDASDHPSTHPANAGDAIIVSVSTVATALLIMAYQNSIPRTLEAVFCQQVTPSQQPSRLKIALNLGSAGWKTVGTAASMFALLYRMTSHRLGVVPAIIATLFFSPGNFMANAAILLGPVAEKVGVLNSPRLTRYIAGYLALCYALANASMYFNNFSVAPFKLGWLDQPIASTMTQSVNLSHHSARFVESVSGWSGLLVSLHFMAVTYRVWYAKIKDTMQKHTSPSLFPVNRDMQTNRYQPRQRLNTHRVASGVWKTIVTSLALTMGLSVYGLDWPLGLLLAMTLAFTGHGAAQVALYARSDLEIQADTKVSSDQEAVALLHDEQPLLLEQDFASMTQEAVDEITQCQVSFGP